MSATSAELAATAGQVQAQIVGAYPSRAGGGPAAKQEDPSAPGHAHRAMSYGFDLIEALLGGTESMRAAGEKYLPKFPRESDTNYSFRLGRSFLFGGFAKASDDLVNRPFSHPVTMSDDSAQQFRDMAGNVDLAGSTLHIFARDLFESALDFGMAHVLVDFPATPGPLTLAQEREAGVRPYFVLVPAPKLLSFRHDRRGGQYVLTRIRIEEEAVTPLADGSEQTVKRVREYEETAPGTVEWRLWERNEEGRWSVIGNGPVTLGIIPLVTLYSRPRGFMRASPPLLPLAELNLQHWQESSDQQNILHVARVPILGASGFMEQEASQIEIGSSKAVRSENPQARIYFCEHSGAAIGAGRQSLQDLENQMRTAGLDLLQRKAGDETATAKSIDASASMSVIHALARQTEEALEKALQIAGKWMGLGEETECDVQISQDFGLSLRDSTDVDALIKARMGKMISQETFIAEMKRHGVLADSVDPEEEKERLEEEGPDLGSIPPEFGQPAPQAGEGAAPPPAGASPSAPGAPVEPPLETEPPSR